MEETYSIIYRVSELTDTIEQALHHIEMQLDELRIEDSLIIFNDVVTGLKSIDNAIQPLISETSLNEIEELANRLFRVVSDTIDIFNKNNIIALKTQLDTQLIPAYQKWSRKVRLDLSS